VTSTVLRERRDFHEDSSEGKREKTKEPKPDSGEAAVVKHENEEPGIM
jgi:hypothetical protein